MTRQSPFPLLAVGAICAFVAFAERVDTVLSDGWLANGEPVTLPHTWNAVDGADGAAVVHPDARFAGDSVHGLGHCRQAVTYRHALPVADARRRRFVRCEAAATHATVAVNGTVVGRHDGAFTAFCFEITDLLLPSDNVLEIVVDNFYDADTLPRSGDYTVQGGLYRPVHLIETPLVCLDPAGADFGPGVTVETDAVSGRVRAEPLVTRVKGTETNEVRVTFTVAETGESGESPSFVVRGFRRWSPEDPAVYHLRVRLSSAFGEDEVTLPFGFAACELRKDGFYLNGRKRKLRGVNLHQDVAGRGWALRPEDERQAIGLVRGMGADAVRTAHYPQSQNLYDLCDEQGLLAWIEVPITDLLGASAAYRANALRETREMVVQLRHHPCAALWSIENEVRLNWCEAGEKTSLEVLGAVRDEIRRIDPSRPVVQANFLESQTNLLMLTEGVGYNTYPGWYWGNPEKLAGAIDRFCRMNSRFATLCISEYGAGANVNQHENPAPPKCANPDGVWHPEEYQTRHHVEQYRLIRADERIWGSFVWQMFDSAADVRTDGPVRGINDKGLVCRDHVTPKDAFFFYKANWNPEPMLHLCGKRMTLTTNAVAEVLAFSNMGTVTLSVNGKTIGTKNPDEVRTVHWKGVNLVPGCNHIQVTTGGRKESCKWRLEP